MTYLIKRSAKILIIVFSLNVTIGYAATCCIKLNIEETQKELPCHGNTETQTEYKKCCNSCAPTALLTSKTTKILEPTNNIDFFIATIFISTNTTPPFKPPITHLY